MGDFMFLRKAFNKKTRRTYLSIVHSYWIPQDKKTRSKVVKSLGYLDELEKEYDDPISYFTAMAKEMEADRQKENSSYAFSINKKDSLTLNSNNMKNFGYTALSKIYHELDIHTFLTNRQRHTKDEYDADTIMKLLVYSRLLAPSSKKKTYENKDWFFEKVNYSLDDVYRCLTFLNKHKNNLQLWINNKIKEIYGRNTNLIYYDVTNYYFETDKSDDFKRKGVSKEHRPNPIVQMGLFIDNNGLPITYELFPGNTNDCLTYRPNLSRIKKEYNLGKVVTVADKGMTTGDNIWYTLSAGDGYVFSMSVRKATNEIKNYVKDPTGYEWIGQEYKHKSRLIPRTIRVTTTTGKKMNKVIDEKHVVFYSQKYAKKARKDRENTLKKANDLINSPSKYNHSTSYGAAGYIKNIEFDKETGEILAHEKKLILDTDKIKEEEALDGYYLLATSEYLESDVAIIEMYRGLWRIEESFKITKSDLESRPIYVSRQDHIEAHFLICFVALIIIRLLEMKTKHKYSVAKLLESLAKAECIHVKENLYLFGYYDETLKEIGNITNIDFSKKMLPLGEIKKILGNTKK